MARKTVQTKFVSGNIARVDLAPLRKAHRSQFTRWSPRNAIANFLRVPPRRFPIFFWGGNPQIPDSKFLEGGGTEKRGPARKVLTTAHQAWVNLKISWGHPQLSDGSIHKGVAAPPPESRPMVEGRVGG